MGSLVTTLLAQSPIFKIWQSGKASCWTGCIWRQNKSLRQHIWRLSVNRMPFSGQKPPPKPIKCVRKGCNKCLFCYKISAKCQCTAETKATEPPDVMYGWCPKCRDKYSTEYAQLCGNNCTYCGGGIEDNYPAAAIAVAVFCFPIGIIGCCMLKEKQCVKCNRSFS